MTAQLLEGIDDGCHQISTLCISVVVVLYNIRELRLALPIHYVCTKDVAKARQPKGSEVRLAHPTAH